MEDSTVIGDSAEAKGGLAAWRVLTVPNALSALRLLLVPVFLWLVLTDRDATAVVVLVIASVSDFLDGHLARRLRQESRLGALLDPIADRLYIFAAVLAFAWRGILPWWLVAAIIARDVLIAVLGVVLARAGRGALPVTRVGKIATFCLLLALPVLLLGQAYPVAAWLCQPAGGALVILGTVLYWWAGIDYALRALQIVKSTHRREDASDTLETREVDGG